MRIAQYETSSNYIFISEYRDDEGNIPDGWIRISEPLSVEFKSLEKSDITSKKVKHLDKILDSLMSEIERVRAKKQELLALTHEVEQ